MKRRPPLGEHRPNDGDPLRVAHLANAAILGERLCDDELLVGDRIVHRDQPHLGQRSPCHEFRLLFGHDVERKDGGKLLSLSIDERFELNPF